MRICPKCSAYYADDSLTFCLVDGAPLIGVNPTSEKWSEGSKVIEQNQTARRKLRRKLKWRRVIVSATTLLVATTLLLVVTLNGVFHLKPDVFPIPTPTPTPTPNTVYKISGRVLDSGKPRGDVKIFIMDGKKIAATTTDAAGNYTFNDLPADGSYTISPTPEANVNFSPRSATIDKLTQNASADFFAVVETVVYKISGRVMNERRPLSGVKVMLKGAQSRSTVTNADGNYRFDNLPAGGTYSITLTRTKTTFTPPSRFFNKLEQDALADFAAVVEPDVYKISGQVTDAIGPLPDIVIKLEGPKRDSVITNPKGKYTFSNLPGGATYTVTPTGQHKFQPPSRSFPKLARDELSVDFVSKIPRDVKPALGTVPTKAVKDRSGSRKTPSPTP
jgi:hypothetical protein